MRIQRSDPEARTLDGIVFDSIAEMNRYSQLKLMQQAGIIEKLQYEPMFRIEVNGMEICKYKPDFTYIRCDTKEAVLEDVKGWKRTRAGNRVPRVNREFNIKVKLMRACFGLNVEVV